MRIVHIFLVLFTCLCKLQGQVWTNLINSVSTSGPSWFNSAVVDSNTNTLFIGGSFFGLNQFNTNSIIKYNGISFDTLQSGLDDNDIGGTTVRSMQIFQNKLYVFGDFLKTGKYYCPAIGRWNGTSWDTVNFRPHGTVWFSDVFNNELYVAGGFDSIGGIECNSISKFDGVNWFNIGYPVKPNVITAIKVFKGTLYMAGQVSQASSSANLSYYDGTNWTPWVGVSGDNAKYIAGMTVIDSMLYVYGRFNSIAGTNCKGLAAYNGKNWYGFGQGLSSSGWETIKNVKKINGKIYITGLFDKIEGLGNSNLSANFSTNLAEFDGEKWCLISPPFDNEVNGIIGYQNNVYLYGGFWHVGNDAVYGFLRRNGGNSTIACSSSITIVMSTTGINEQLNFEGLKIYPNPVQEVLKINAEIFEYSKFHIQLNNSIGQKIFSSSDLIGDQDIDFKELPRGIYYLEIEKDSVSKVFKIIKQ